MMRCLLTLCALLWCILPLAALPMQRDQRRNDPAACPYCRGDPEIMAKAGLRSHGGFDFGRTNTAEVDALLATSDIRWIETAHFEIGFALPPIKMTVEEREKVREELARLGEHLIDVPTKPTILDSWLRTHLYAQRCEDLWKKFLALLNVSESDFPDGLKLWDRTGTYMGEGPYLGQKGKYEILIAPSQGSAGTFLQDHFGVVTKLTQRYNVFATDSLILVIHSQQEGLRVDEALHGHLVFNLVQNLLDGYKHYTYSLPVWLLEGLSHYFERDINPKFNTFDASEGSIAEMTRKENWEPPTLKLVRSGKAPRLAELMAMKDFADLTLERHYATWSMIDYILRVHPGGIAKLLGDLKGITNEQGIGDGSNLSEVHRASFKEIFGFSYAEFDAAWQAWVAANYAAQ